MKLLCSLIVPLCCLSAVIASDKIEKPSDSGNAFLRLCSAVDKEVENEQDLLAVTNCFMYVQGLGDGIGLEHFHAERVTRTRIEESFCGMPADGLENGQVVRIVLKYVRSNPAKAHLPTAQLFFLAMQEAFPCKRGAPIQF